MADEPQVPNPAAESVTAETPATVTAVLAVRKRKTSRGLREAQRLERRMSKAAHRLAKATAEGIAEYRAARDRSAEKKKDGAVRDFPVNVAEGMGAAMRAASRVPVDLVRGFGGRRALKEMRRGARILLRPLVR
jgi:hypothetical protein